VSAAAAARADAQDFGFAAVEAYREVGDRAAVAAATARLGRVLIDAGEIDRAREVLERAIPEAETLDDRAPLAALLANLARVHMRVAETDAAIAAADRALAIAERLNLEPVITEALENKAAALNISGRRRESLALHAAALELAQGSGDRALELRILNNFASGLEDDDPVRGSRMLVESTAVARDIGDRGLYYFQLGQVAIYQTAQGVNWDENVAALREALETATLRNDRLRLRLFLGLIESARGERTDEFLGDIEELTRNQPGVEERFTVYLTRAEHALRAHDYAAAYRWAIEASDLNYQSPEVPAEIALRAAMRARDADGILRSAALSADLQGSGVLTELHRGQAAGAVAAIEGRFDDAAASFTSVQSGLAAIEQRYLAALMAIDALTLAPHIPALRAHAEAARPLLEGLRATADLEDLDRAIAESAGIPGSSSPVAEGSDVPSGTG
jgi:tetratricopeptide (TPR) repeat protein